MSAGRTGAPSRRGRSDDHPSRSSSPILTLRGFDPCSIPPRLGTVAPIQVMRLDPFLGDDGRAEGQLTAENGRGHDFGELADLAGAIAAEHLEALPLACQAGAARSEE